MGKDSLLSFSRPGENSVHLMNLLHALDQHSGNTLSKISTVELGMDPIDGLQENIGVNTQQCEGNRICWKGTAE